MTFLLQLYYLIGSLLFMAELLVGEFLFSLKYKRRPAFIKRAVLSCLAALPFVMLITFAYANLAQLQNDLLTSIVVVVTYLLMFSLSLIITYVCYDEAWPSLIICGIASYAAQHLIFNILNIIRSLTDLYSFAFANPLNNLIFNSAQIGIFAAGYCLIYFIFIRRANRSLPDGIVGKSVLLLSAITLVVTLIFNGVRDFFIAESTGLYVLCCFFSIMSCIFILVIRTGIFEQNRLKQEVEIINKLMADDRKQLEMSKENIELINIKCHDIRRQLDVFRMSGKAPTGEELTELNNTISIYDAMLKTGNETLDIILTERSLYCEKHGIRLTCNVDGEKLGFMRISDISSLFGNALTNAIEAVIGLEDKEKRVISLVIKGAVGQLSILVENYYAGDITFTGGLPATIKENKEYHGYGIKSIKMIVEKYDGSLSFNTSDGVFRLMAMIPLP